MGDLCRIVGEVRDDELGTGGCRNLERCIGSGRAHAETGRGAGIEDAQEVCGIHGAGV